jgi:hypothetical protein
VEEFDQTIHVFGNNLEEKKIEVEMDKTTC